MSASPRRTKRRSDLELLEDRKLLASFGTPWPDARDLTVSFPADGTAVGGEANDIHEALESVAEDQAWQELALRAFQTWSYHADINVGLTNDHGNVFGAKGLSVADPRFGDFRIGAFPQDGIIANVLPFQAVAGTYSGDLLLNSNETFTLHDWADDLEPDSSNQPATARDLFSVFLHESGNALGLSDSALDGTVMFGQYTVPKGVLTQDDIDRIQELYGARSDPFETVDNGQLAVASAIATPVGFQPDADVISNRGSLLNGDDVDVYQLNPIAGRQEVTINLHAAGISMLKSKLEVLDSAGQVIATSSAASVFENDHSIHLTEVSDHAALYLKVSAAGDDTYAFGDYELQVDYRSGDTRALDPVAAAYDEGADALFSNFGLADLELGDNDSIADAAVPISAAGFEEDSRYEFESAVSAASDVDYWKITAPENVSGALSISLAGVGLDQPGLKIRVLDANDQPVGASGRLLANGTWRLRVAQPDPGQQFFLRVSVDPSSTVEVGNYVATAEFMTPSTEMTELASGNVTSTVDDFYRWTVNKSKLFRFDLSAFGATNDEPVRVTIYDAHTKQVRMVLASRPDVTRSAFAWLAEGDYLVRVSAVTESVDPADNVGYTLSFIGVSDDQDPDQGEDEYEHYGYEYAYEYSTDETDGSEPPAYYYYYADGYGYSDYEEYEYYEYATYEYAYEYNNAEEGGDGYEYGAGYEYDYGGGYEYDYGGEYEY